MIIKQLRNKFYPSTTISNLFVNDNPFSYCLEDTVRAIGIKVPSFTAIPENLIGYNIDITYSPHFKRDVVVLYTYKKDGLFIINNGGVIFTQVYSHGGNDIADTDGCILIAKHFGLIKKIPKIWDTMENEMFNLVKIALDKHESVKWIIKNVTI